MPSGPESKPDGENPLVLPEDLDPPTPAESAPVALDRTPGDWDDGSSSTPDPQVRWAIGGAVAAVAVLLVASLIIPAGRHQWVVSFVRQPTPTTSLAFTHPTALPSSVTSGAPVALAFTVTNHEGRYQHYQYVVTSQSPGQAPSVVAQGAVGVADGRARSVVRHVVPRCTRSSCLVEVALPEQAVLIDVRLDLHTPAH